MRYKKLLALMLVIASIKPMEKTESKIFYDEIVAFIDTMDPLEDPLHFNKKIKTFLKEKGASKEEKQELKKTFALKHQPTFHEVKTLAFIKLLACSLGRNSTVAWVDTLDTSFNIYRTHSPDVITRIKAHDSVINWLSLSSDQKYLVSCAQGKGSDGLNIWRIHPDIGIIGAINYRKVLKKLEISNNKNTTLLKTQLSPCNRFVACCDVLGNLVLLTIDLECKHRNTLVTTQNLIKSFNNPNTIITFALHKFTLLALNNNQLLIYNLNNQELISESTVKKSWFDCIISPDCNSFAFKHHSDRNAERKVTIFKKVNNSSFKTISLHSSEHVNFDAANNILMMDNGEYPECHQFNAHSSFLLPDWSSMQNACPSPVPEQTFFAGALIDQREPFKIASIYIPEWLSFKKLYLHMHIQKAIKEQDKEQLKKLRAHNLIDRYGTPELLKGYIDNALAKINEL